MSKIVCIDAGHGGRDSGAVNGSRYEKYDTLKLALLLKKSLQKSGVTVILTRSEDKYVTLQERTDLANSKEADLFISLHRNAFTNSGANGVEAWVYLTATGETHQYAALVLNELESVGIQVLRGLKQGNFHVTRETKMPSCLLELGFISNKKDNELFDEKIYQYADAIARAMCTFLGIKPDEDIIDEGNCSDGAACKLYRVQVGAYKNAENAHRVADELKELGYSTFVF